MSLVARLELSKIRVMCKKRELQIVVDSLEMRLATYKTLWSGKGGDMPADGIKPPIIAELEDLLERYKRYQDFGYKEQFRDLLDRLEEERQGGLLPLLISEVLAEYGDDTLRWCECLIAEKRAEIKSREMEYKQNLCESENL